MEPETFEQKRDKHDKIYKILIPLGWRPVGMLTFSKNGKIYDLSTADISQIDRIEKEGLFLL